MESTFFLFGTVTPTPRPNLTCAIRPYTSIDLYRPTWLCRGLGGGGKQSLGEGKTEPGIKHGVTIFKLIPLCIAVATTTDRDWPREFEPNARILLTARYIFLSHDENYNVIPHCMGNNTNFYLQPRSLTICYDQVFLPKADPTYKHLNVYTYHVFHLGVPDRGNYGVAFTDLASLWGLQSR